MGSLRAVSSMEHVIIAFASYKGHGHSYNPALNFTTQILSIPLLWHRFPYLKEVGFFVNFFSIHHLYFKIEHWGRSRSRDVTNESGATGLVPFRRLDGLGFWVQV